MQPIVDINYLAVLIAALINMFLGMLWYSPYMFGKMWIAALGKSEEELKKSASGPIYIVSMVAALILAYVLAHIIIYAQATTVVQGIQTGFWVWVGFTVTTLLPVYLYEKRPMKIYFIYIIYQFIALVLMGLVLAIWK